MKVRRTLTLGVGAALGASGMYLFDPEHGSARRREALRAAGRRVRDGVDVDLDGMGRGARRLADRARQGFAAGRSADD